MDKNKKCLCCYEVEIMEFFELLGIRCGDMNAVTEEI